METEIACCHRGSQRRSFAILTLAALTVAGAGCRRAKLFPCEIDAGGCQDNDANNEEPRGEADSGDGPPPSTTGGKGGTAGNEGAGGGAAGSGGAAGVGGGGAGGGAGAGTGGAAGRAGAGGVGAGGIAGAGGARDPSPGGNGGRAGHDGSGDTGGKAGNGGGGGNGGDAGNGGNVGMAGASAMGDVAGRGGGGDAGGGGVAGMSGGGAGMSGVGGGGSGGDAGGSGGAVSTAQGWPGRNAVVVVDGTNAFAATASGITYQPATGAESSLLWVVGSVEHPPKDGPALLYRLAFDGTVWTSTSTNDWIAGKTILYADGVGSPDAEGVTKAELDSSAIYVAAERSNDANTVSRLSVLRFDTADLGTSLIATHEWNLTADLPTVAANFGFESLTWVPDSYLVANAFVDETTMTLYAPQAYPNHGTGLVFVGLERLGMIYAYALDHVGGGFHRVAAFPSGMPQLMELQFDRDVGALWATCDNSCGNLAAVLQIDLAQQSSRRGQFVVRALFNRPSTLPDVNNEGFAIAPEAECTGGYKHVFWSDDRATGGHSLREDTIPCGAFFNPEP